MAAGFRNYARTVCVRDACQSRFGVRFTGASVIPIGDHADDRVIRDVKCFTEESRWMAHGLGVGRSCPNTAPVDRITLIHVNPDLNSPGCFGSRAFFCRSAW
jgi:hypothetical protein